VLPLLPLPRSSIRTTADGGGGGGGDRTTVPLMKPNYQTLIIRASSCTPLSSAPFAAVRGDLL